MRLRLPRPPPPPQESSVLVRLVAGSVAEQTFVLDAIMHRNPHDEFGEPVALVLARPDTAWFDTAVGELLDAWARRSEALQVSVRTGRRGSVAVLRCPAGPTTLRLDLLEVA